MSDLVDGDALDDDILERLVAPIGVDGLDRVDHPLRLLVGNLGSNYEILGLYRGIALTERDSWYAGSLPDTITIYREALLDFCDSEADVVDEVAITVIHEIAHHFGIDDERLHELGWG